MAGDKYQLSTAKFCNVRQKTLQKFVKLSFKMSNCAISKNAQNQDGRPDRYWKLKKRMKESAKTTPHPHPGT